MLKSNIGTLLKNSKYNREYVQKYLGVSANTLSNWSTNRSIPSLEKAFKLAMLLDVKVDDLYMWIDDEK
ncbi:helix-turn-helix transcriptional regulator [Heyndrickxia oleronia]|jgi:DNA-binding XRE family transcriptional regulator|uniref:helix-turn-helix transcriptional regulator n=1 Tax=Heyndrickxia oleronia TaxID=38875 RepID=UPI00242B2F68|nr:helix-turn-helix transcriptional regulator [Heyndrickxia oleronia]MCI1615409.1 helix-turn-helix domain-containing protein [Heyndrickxia oleronia]MCI1746576.1 helix-turn-helix domain-containing protein [Heyndrickxia oleronia]